MMKDVLTRRKYKSTNLEMSKYFPLLLYNYFKNIVKFENKCVKKYGNIKTLQDKVRFKV